MSSGHFLSILFAIFHPPTSSHYHHSLIHSIIDLDSYEQCYKLMWLQQCIKNACTSHIWTRASLTRDSSHCLLSVSKWFVFGITPEWTQFSSDSLQSPLKKCSIYVSIDLQMVWAIGSLYIKHTLSQVHYLLLPWSFYSFQDESFIKQLHISSVDTQDYCKYSFCVTCHLPWLSVTTTTMTITNNTSPQTASQFHTTVYSPSTS